MTGTFRAREGLAPRGRPAHVRWALPAVAAGLLWAGAALAQTGTDSPPPAAEPAETAAPAQSAAAAPVLQGKQVFQSACVACHGVDGRGGYGGGVPLDEVRDPAMVMATVTDGRGNMPPLGDLLTAEQISAVAAYIVNELFK